MNTELLAQELTRDEGKRNRVYTDSVGIPTIGVGRNLRDVGLSDDEVDYLLANDIKRAIAGLFNALPWVENLSDNRQRALVNMVFNMGLDSFLGFKNTIALLQSGNFESASHKMLDSKWAQQVGPRAARIAQMIREG